MKGIDIIEAMGGIDDELILEARRPRRRTPRLLGWISIAACLLCALIMGFLFFHRITGGRTAPDVLAPGATAAPAPVPSAAELPVDAAAQEIPKEEAMEELDQEVISEAVSLETAAPVIAELEDGQGLLLSFQSADGSHDIRVWQLYRVALEDFRQWDNEALLETLEINVTPDFSWEEWQVWRLFGAIFEVGMDEEYVYLLDLTTEIDEILASEADFAAYMDLRYQCVNAVSAYLADAGAEENPNWQDYYLNCTEIDARMTSGTTVPELAEGPELELPRFRITSVGTEYIAMIFDPYTLSRTLPEASGLGWVLRREAMNAEELEAEGADYALIVGYDGTYTYYLSLPGGSQYLAEDPISRANYYGMMRAGKNTIARMLERNGITPAEGWESLYDALWDPESFLDDPALSRWIYP